MKEVYNSNIDDINNFYEHRKPNTIKEVSNSDIMKVRVGINEDSVVFENCQKEIKKVINSEVDTIEITIEKKRGICNLVEIFPKVTHM